jgi:hypothetical protein
MVTRGRGIAHLRRRAYGRAVTAPRRLPPTASPSVAVLGKALVAHIDELTDTLVDAILREDPSYSGPGRTPREDLERSCHANLLRILQSLTGDTDPDTDPFDAPRATGRRRAEQGMPLESVLHAYRVGFRVIWEGLVAEARRSGGGIEGLVDAATEVWELVDVFSNTVADSYRSTEAEFARRDDRRRDALVDALLEGRGTERAVAADAAAALDLPEHGRYAVVVVAGEEVAPGVAGALRTRGMRCAWRTRTDREIGLVALGPQTPGDLVAVLDGVGGLRAGVSPAVEGLAEVDVAHRLAETALRALPRGESAVAELDSRLAGALLVTAPDLAGRLVHRALGGVLVLETDERKVLLDTLRTWLDTGGSAGQTAARLYCHRNTVLNRLRRLEGLTGRSLERVDHLVEWSLALLALDVLPPEAARPPAPAR